MKFAFSKAAQEPDEIRFLKTSFRELGYDGLQLKGNQYGDYLDSAQPFLEDWPLEGVASALIAGGDLGEASRAQLRSIFAFANAVGSQRIVFCHGVPREGLQTADIKAFARQLSDVASEARDHGLAFSLHHHFNNPVMHRDDFDVFFETAHGVGLTVDTAHLVKSGIEDIAEVIASFAPVIDNFHLKDFADGDWRMLGRGRIDFAPVFAAIEATGYDGWVSTDEESGADVQVAMKECLALMRAGLARRL